MPTCHHLCCLLLSKAVSASRRTDSRESAPVAVAPGRAGESLQRRVVVNEIASGAASTSVAVCCFPLAIVYSILLLFLFCPCSLLLKLARGAKTLTRRTRPGACEKENPALLALPAREEENSALILLPTPRVNENISDLRSHFPSHGWKFSFGFGMESGGRTMAFHADIDCNRFLSRVPALIRHKICELKTKRISDKRKRRRNDRLSCHRLPQIESPLPSSSSGSPCRDQWPLCGGESGGRTMAFHADIDCNRFLSRVPALIRHKICELKMKRISDKRKRRRNDRLSCHRLPQIESPLPSSSSGSPGREQWPLCGGDGERGRGMVARGFDHPFWQEHFECDGRQLGFWRGLDLRDS